MQVDLPHQKGKRKAEFPEQELLKRYHMRNRNAKREKVLDLHGGRTIPAIEFVKRQLKLMEKDGLKEKDAYFRVKQELYYEQKQKENEGVSDMNLKDETSLSLKKKFDEWNAAEEAFLKAKATSSMKKKE